MYVAPKHPSLGCHSTQAITITLSQHSCGIGKLPSPYLCLLLILEISSVAHPLAAGWKPGSPRKPPAPPSLLA